MSCCPQDVTWINSRIAAIQAQIVALEDAYLALATDNIAQYSLNSGQTQQTVTKLNITSLRGAIDSLENRLQFYQDKLCAGSRVYNYRPGW
jgi:hypothetical protein